MFKESFSKYLDRQDSEKWHNRAHFVFSVASKTPFGLKVVEKLFAFEGRRFTNPRLATTIGSVALDNPIGLGAGWDKTGTAVSALYSLGFSFIEVGSVPVYFQTGNEKPRMWQAAPGVVINNLGLNSPGMKSVSLNLSRVQGVPVGINIGKNKEVDNKYAPGFYAIVAKTLYIYASYFVINVSSPNTQGLKMLQKSEFLRDIIRAVSETVNTGGDKPIFVKISPDLSLKEVEAIVQAVIDCGITGIVATNTTDNPNIKAKYGSRWQNTPGGLSGNEPEFRQISTSIILHINNIAGNSLEIIGVGGVNDYKSALEKLMAGARAVQLVTAMRQGPWIVGKINHDLISWMNNNKVKTISEVIGTKEFGEI